MSATVNTIALFNDFPAFVARMEENQASLKAYRLDYVRERTVEWIERSANFRLLEAIHDFENPGSSAAAITFRILNDDLEVIGFGYEDFEGIHDDSVDLEDEEAMGVFLETVSIVVKELEVRARLNRLEPVS